MPEGVTSGGRLPSNVPRMLGGAAEADFNGFASSSPRSVPPAGGSNAPPIFRPSAPVMPNMMRFRGPPPGAFDGAFDMPPPDPYHNDHDHPDEVGWLELSEPELEYMNPWGLGTRNVRSPGLMPRE